MVPAKKGTYHPTLEEVRKRFDGWRRDRRGRDPIPEALWKAAVSLTGARSINEVARRLHLNHTDLKTCACGANRMAFIELNPATTINECTIEMEKPTGERMRIRGSCNVVELARVFLT
jgi:hypothetical protein